MKPLVTSISNKIKSIDLCIKTHIFKLAIGAGHN